NGAMSLQNFFVAAGTIGRSGSFATDRYAMKIGPRPQCSESDGRLPRGRPSRRARAQSRCAPARCAGTSAESRYRSFRLNVQLANHLAEIVEFLSEKSSEFRAANARRVKRQGNELRLHLGHVQGRVKPIDEPSKRFLRRIRWCNDSLPNVCVD